MKKRNFSWSVAIWALCTVNVQAGNESYTSFHEDYRKTPKLETGLNHHSAHAVDGLTQATEFLKNRANSFGFKQDLSELKFVRSQPSLLGTHYYFKQVLNGTEIRFGEVVVSVSADSNSVYQVFNNFYPRSLEDNEMSNSKSSKSILSVSRAYDIAWANLRVHGKLISEPKAKILYRVDEKTGEFKLVYLTYLHTEEPAGAWEHEVDAMTGKILSRNDTILERKPTTKVYPEFYNGPVIDRADAFKAFAEEQKLKAKSKLPTSEGRADGAGIVFDPDPRTTLNDETLSDNSPAELFEFAYRVVALPDLSFDGSVYSLEGPWVKIADFESPRNPPSTSSDGKWTAKRGNNAFNDAMTYYHIDKNQRYMQSLGFIDDRSIQGGPIETDSDGLSGQDNSHFIPGSNRIAFGHGCVDDNEDADVILHEYGHAINHSINANWQGGDTGAMGEGFGDYWAGSYSVSTLNGLAHHPESVFSWDGHGVGDPCWPGRELNALELRYDPNKTYQAHQGIGLGRSSDELWSTPLFQTLLTLMEMGVSREDVDQIILEAQFGLGANLKMRDLAQVTIATAKRLKPGGPHAQVFIDKFAAQNIIDVPHAVLEMSDISILDSGNNGYLDPGELAKLQLRIKNRGTLSARDIKLKLRTLSEGVTIQTEEINVGSVEVGAEMSQAAIFDVSIAQDLNCGDKLSFVLDVLYEDATSNQREIDFEVGTGEPLGFVASFAQSTTIPDNGAGQVLAEVNVSTQAFVSENIKVNVNIEHTFIGDLQVSIIAPSGKEVMLHNRSGGGDDDLRGTYPTELVPAQSLNDLVGEAINGTWKLKIIDFANQDVGTLKSYEVQDVTGYQCQQ